MIVGHGGNIFEASSRLGCRVEEILDMSSNMNPIGPLPELMTHLKENLNAGTYLPEADAGGMVKLFCERRGISPEQVLAGNGTTQFIYMLPQALSPRRSVILGPTYADYGDASNLFNIPCKRVNAAESALFLPDLTKLSDTISEGDLVFICNANNPTGTVVSRSDLENISQKHPEALFVIDESYLPFAEDGDSLSMISCGRPNVMVLYSMSKIHKIPGLRVGFLVAPRKIAERVRKFHLPWSVNGLAQSAVSFLLTGQSTVNAFIRDTRNYVRSQIRILQADLEASGLFKVFPSQTPFLLIKLLRNRDAQQICDVLCKEKILIRNCGNFIGLSDRFIRISLKSSDENRRISERLISVCRKAANLPENEETV